MLAARAPQAKIKENSNFLPDVCSSIDFFIRIGTSPVLQHHFTGVRTVSPTAGLDRVTSQSPIFKHVTVTTRDCDVLLINMLSVFAMVRLIKC